MNGSSPLKLAATAVALVLVTSMVIAVIAWTSSDVEWRVEATPVEPVKTTTSMRMAVVAPQASAMATPPPYAVAACHRQASRPANDEAQPEALKAGVLGSGTLYGLDQNQKRDDRYRDAYARCMRSRGYSS
jgi:hypothetical protein